MSNQSKRQESVRAVTGTAYPYEGDWHALFDMAGIPVGSFNGRMLAWINDYMGESFTELNGAMAAFAQDQGYSDWNSMGTFDAGGVVPWTPADIPDLALWLDAADAATITQSGGAVSLWADKSGLGNNATATGSSQPTTGTRTQNGLNALDFDGSTDFMSLPSSLYTLGDGPATIMAVVLYDTVKTERTIHAGVGTSARIMLRKSNTNAYQTSYNSSATASASGINLSTATPYMLGLSRSGGIKNPSVNGVDGTASTAQDTGAVDNLRIGGVSSGTENHDGLICEILFWSRDLSDTEQEQVYTYLSTKWGISYTPAARGLTVFGDSITVGSAASPDSNSWANLYATHLGLTLNNKGISGTVLQNSPDASTSPRSSNGRDRFMADTLGGNRGEKLVIAYGFNDLRYTGAPSTFNVTNFENDLREVVQGCIDGGYDPEDITIMAPYYLTTTGYATGSAGFTGSDVTIHQTYIDACEAVAEDFRTYYVDMRTYMLNNGADMLISGDNIHPNNTGHTVIYDGLKTSVIP